MKSAATVEEHGQGPTSEPASCCYRHRMVDVRRANQRRAATVTENGRGPASKAASFVSGDKVQSVAVIAAVGKSEAAGGNRTESATDNVMAVNSAMTGNSALKTSGNRTDLMMAMALAGNLTLATSNVRMDINNSATGRCCCWRIVNCGQQRYQWC